MITVSSPSKPFIYTVKLTARRQSVTTDYKEEIRALYHATTLLTQSAEADQSESVAYLRKLNQDFSAR